jgi:hypothetical protein
VLSGASEPVGALIGYFVLTDDADPLVYGITFGLVAGIMVCVRVCVCGRTSCVPPRYVWFKPRPPVHVMDGCPHLHQIHICLHELLPAALRYDPEHKFVVSD